MAVTFTHYSVELQIAPDSVTSKSLETTNNVSSNKAVKIIKWELHKEYGIHVEEVTKQVAMKSYLYIINELYSVIEIITLKLGCIRESLRWITKRGITLQQTCNKGPDLAKELPSVMRLLKTGPCELLQYKVRLHEKTQWKIKVFNEFMINITIHEAYTPYSDDCEGYSINVADGKDVNENILINLCGYIVQESVYTASEHGIINVNIVNPTEVHFIITYQVHITGYAYRFRNATLNHLNHSIISYSTPTWIFYHNSILEYIWYYSIPPSIDHLHVLDGKLLTIFAPKLVIEHFSCSLDISLVFFEHGLQPRGWMLLLPSLSPRADVPLTIDVSKHKYTTILLRTTIETILFIIIDIKVSKDSQKVQPENDLVSTDQHVNKGSLYYSHFRSKYNRAMKFTLDYLSYEGSTLNMPLTWITNFPAGHELILQDTRGRFVIVLHFSITSEYLLLLLLLLKLLSYCPSYYYIYFIKMITLTEEHIFTSIYIGL